MSDEDDEAEAEDLASTAELSLSDILGVLNKPEKQVWSVAAPAPLLAFTRSPPLTASLLP
jgi:hypothetical protein